MKGLVHGKLIRRYKRFLADVMLDGGEQATVHCPNTGSMKNCVEAGADVWLSVSDNPKRKYRFTWEYMRTGADHFIGINTGRANWLVEEALQRRSIDMLAGYQEIRREVRYGEENSRIDFQLSKNDGSRNSEDICYVEVKSVTLLESPVTKGIGYFPDAVSERGAKHLRELMLVRQGGEKAVLLFCVQHTGIREVRPADHIDEHYGVLLREAVVKGVDIIAYKVRRTATGFRLWRAVPVVL